MKQDIKYTGLSANPSDHEAPDGDLTTALNLVPEDGQIKPIFQPKDICGIPDTHKVLYIHTTTAFSHIILQKKSNHSILWVDMQNIPSTVAASNMTSITATPGDVLKISSIGNTLVIISNSGLHYILWNNDRYTYLGTKPPLVPISFGTSETKTDEDYGRLASSYGSTYYNTPYVAWRQYPQNILPTGMYEFGPAPAYDYIRFKNEYQDDITQCVWALINTTNSEIREQGHFYAPFFVRYCYRLYDGSMIMQSAPIFMPVSMSGAFRVELANGFTRGDGQIRVLSYNSNLGDSFHDNMYFVEANNSRYYEKDVSKRLTFKYRPANVALTYKCDEATLTELCSTWSDIVKSIDIFISAPIIREDSDKKITTARANTFAFHYENNNTTTEVYATFHDDTGTDQYPVEYPVCPANVVCDIPMLTDDEYLEKIKSVDNFYLVHSFDLSEPNNISTGSFAELPIGTSILDTLTEREAMDSDFKSNNTLLPTFDISGQCISTIFSYNNRLNIAGVREQLFNGFGIENLVPKTNTGDINIHSIIVHLDTDYGDKTVVHQYETPVSTKGLFVKNLPLFYPDNRAVRMEIIYDNPSGRTPDTIYKTILMMSQCPMINGAFTKGGIITSLLYTLDSEEYDENEESPSMGDAIVPIENKIYTSEINNPFYLPITNTIGTGSIIGISTAAKALSQGQFGQFPLYAFCTDGVWALEVSTTGTYIARQPITRDVCINPDSITQIDNAVLFASNRGIMHISGSKAICITDVIATEYPFNVLTKLSHASDLHSMLDHNADTCLPTQPFLGFLSGCRMVYDYVNQHIIIYNPLLDEHSHRHERTVGGLYDPVTDTYTPVHTEVYYTYTYTPHYTYAYVFSLKSKLWGMMYSNLASSLNSYPDALAMSQDNHLVSFSDTDQDICKGLLITRPLKLGDGDTLKSIHTLLQRGNFQRGDVNTVLYGSRDLVNWHIIASSVNHEIRNLRGTPYKYFRVASVATLTPDKSIYGITVDVEPRHTSVLQ